MRKLKNKKMLKNQRFIDIYGIHAVQAAIKNPKRNHQKLVILDSFKDLKSYNFEKNVEKIVKLTKKEMIKFYGSEKVNQGIVLTTSVLEQPSIQELLNKSKNRKKEIILMLDRVNDPNNVGAIMRSCLLFNCKSIIVPKDNSPEITSSMVKAASGAVESVNYIRVTNIVRTIDEFKNNNFWVCGLDQNKKKLINEFSIPKKCLMILGGEGKGLRDLTKKKCDEIVSIPINEDKHYMIESLNVSNACTIALYENFIQKN